MAVDATGRIVVGGYSYQGNTYDFAVTRLEGGTASLSTSQLLALLNQQIDRLVMDGRLTSGQGQSLQAKLKDVIDTIDADHLECRHRQARGVYQSRACVGRLDSHS